jgi:hypothetical protein
LAVFYGLGKWVGLEVVEMFVAEHLKAGFPDNPIVKEDIAKVFTIGMFVGRLRRVLMPAAFVVHMWLPLFGICVLLLRPLNYFRSAVGAVQWFLKKGQEHPLDAIGNVAAGLVFVVALVIQHIT